MVSRRLFGACMVCSAAGLLASGASAQAPTRTTIATSDYPGDGKISILQVLDAPAGTVIPRHTHPGIESSVVMEGEIELEVAGQGSRSVKAGEGFLIPPGVVHGGKVGAQRAKLAITYVVEKDKPLASPA